MSADRFSPAEVGQFERDGYVLVRQLFDAEEMKVLLNFAKHDLALQAGASPLKLSLFVDIRTTLKDSSG